MIEKINILFVCSANTQRSPTFESWFKKNRPMYNVRSTGIYYGYPERLNEEILKWADKIYCMDLSQEMFIYRKFPEFMHKVSVIGVSDQYYRDSPELNELIWYWTKKINL